MQVFEITQPLFKRDTKGSIRTWVAETGTDGTNWFWRTRSGLETGKKVTSEWKSVEQKNLGKVNETSLSAQASAEMWAEFKKRQDKGFFSNIQDIDTYDKFKPMLAAKHEDAKYDFYGKTYYSQPKLDGIRCIARADGLWTRAGKPIVSCPHLIESLAPFFKSYPDAILDGELYNHDLRDDFNKITSIVRKTKPTSDDYVEAADLVQYHVYDIGSSLDKFWDRINFIFDNLKGLTSINPVSTRRITNQQEMDDLYGSYLEDGFEGQMIRENDVYETKRSKYLLKRKEFLDAEFDVVSMEEGKGNWSGMAKRFILKLDDTRNFGAGVRGKQDVLKELWDNNITPNWVTLRYFTPTPDGVPRFPVVVDWGFGSRDD